MIEKNQWNQAKDWLKQEVGEANFASWLQPLDIDTENTNQTRVTLTVPTRFNRDWVLRHYSKIIQTAVQNVTEKNLEVSFIVKSEHAPKAEQLPEAAITEPVKKPTAPENTNNLNPNYTFDNFVVGKSNEFAYQAAMRIADFDDAAFNPFVLYGGVGLGKTHLMHSIAWHIQKKFPKRKVLYVSSEKFLNSFIAAIRNKKVQDFKQTFRSVDVLMIDDVQFIAGKTSSQEEFFHTFNELVDMGKQIVLTADKSPHELQGIEDRLRSRLGSGLATEIHNPDMETRLAILEKKAEDLNIDLPNDVAKFLADGISSNVRELEGALNRIAAHASLVRQKITIESAEMLLKDLFRVYNRTVNLDDIQKKVAEYFKIKVSDMHSPSRSRKVARPRQIAMYISKNATTKSYPEIGRAFGGRDHTTVMHACKQIENLIKTDSSVQEDVHLLQSMIKNS